MTTVFLVRHGQIQEFLEFQTMNAGDNDILDDIYVAAMGGGYGISLRVLDQI